MPEVRIVAEPRTEFGKGAARRVRRAHKVPAVLYGHGAAPRHLSLPGHELMLALKTPNVLLTLSFPDGDDELALPRQIQRDPVKGFLEHVDLLVVRRGERVQVEIPLVFVGETPADGLFTQQMNTVLVEADATHLPQQVEVDQSGLEIGSSVHARDLVLPENVTLIGDPDELVAHISASPSAAEMGEEQAGEEAAEAGEAEAAGAGSEES